jgi:hypothetical protein
MHLPIRTIAIVIIMLLTDWYVFQAVKVVANNTHKKIKGLVFNGLRIISGFSVFFFIFGNKLHIEKWNADANTYIYATIFILFIAKIIALVFLILDDTQRLLFWGGRKLVKTVNKSQDITQPMLSRSTFLSWIGLGLGSSLSGTMMYGFSNMYRYRVEKITLSYPNLPIGFKGLKIVHISDIHSGSLTNHEAVAKGVQMILDCKPDIIFFTGDLVNNEADEMKQLKVLFSTVKAPLGVYSTLGNHDYGDYKKWNSPEAKIENLETLKAIHAEMGWRLLMNEHVEVEKNGSKLALLGIENWSATSNFPKYGKMKEAIVGTEQYPFKILLSHDPSHWNAEILPSYSDIHLMLSGHTHGMQFGVDIPGIRWSPIQYYYKQWAGLYQSGNQKLYVNRGFGCIGYPGRVGILPEITLIELI